MTIKNLEKLPDAKYDSGSGVLLCNGFKISAQGQDKLRIEQEESSNNPAMIFTAVSHTFYGRDKTAYNITAKNGSLVISNSSK